MQTKAESITSQLTVHWMLKEILHIEGILMKKKKNRLRSCGRAKQVNIKDTFSHFFLQIDKLDLKV